MDEINFYESTPKKPNKSARIYFLVHWFVTDYLGRVYTPKDMKSEHSTHAKSVLMDYSEQDVIGCLKLLKLRIIDTGKWQVTRICQVRNGEPSYMEQYKAWCLTPPPFYNKALVEQWEQVTGKVAYPQAETVRQAVEVPILPSVASVTATF